MLGKSELFLCSGISGVSSFFFLLISIALTVRCLCVLVLEWYAAFAEEENKCVHSVLAQRGFRFVLERVLLLFSLHQIHKLTECNTLLRQVGLQDDCNFMLTKVFVIHFFFS